MKAMVYSLGMVLMVSVVLTGCTQAVHTQPEESETPQTPEYQILLGKSLRSGAVMEFLGNHNCSAEGVFQLCKEVGMALWIDSSRIVKTVYLYSGNADGFRRYKGKLPFGLSFYDPMWLVENKLRNPNAGDKLQQAGLPDEGSTPDHMHYWAVYKRLGIIVIYNSPTADEDAYIYAVLVGK